MNFTVETTEVAEAEIDAIFLYLNARNPDFAGRWLIGLNRSLAELSVFPGRHPRVENNALRGREVRKALYRNGRTAYQILFSLINEDANGKPDTVRVLMCKMDHGDHLGSQRTINESRG